MTRLKNKFVGFYSLRIKSLSDKNSIVFNTYIEAKISCQKVTKKYSISLHWPKMARHKNIVELIEFVSTVPFIIARSTNNQTPTAFMIGRRVRPNVEFALRGPVARRAQLGLGFPITPALCGPGVYMSPRPCLDRA